METTYRFKAGERVRVVRSDKYSGLGTVEKQLPKNVNVMLDSGKRVRFDPYFLEPVDGDAPQATATLIDTPTYVPPPMPGTFVRVDAKVVARQPKLKGLWVVGGTHGDKSRLFRVNNEDGQYWRVPNDALVKVDVEVTEL